MSIAADTISALPGVPPSLLGESPLWLAESGSLLWCDIPGRCLNRWRMADGRHDSWSFDEEVACAAPLASGQLLLAGRHGLYRFDPQDGRRERIAEAPYDPARQRFNDGKADPQGRLWVGTMCEQRDAAEAALFRWADGQLVRMAGDITVSNGLAWSPDGATMYWSDTRAHRIDAFDFAADDGSLSRQRCFARFDAKPADGSLDGYRGRPDGAAVDGEGAYWVAMFEGARLLRLAPDGSLLRDLPLPVRCPTMPCFGGPDLRTLFITTARHGRPAAELARQPLAGCVLTLRVDVPGLPVNHACD